MPSVRLAMSLAFVRPDRDVTMPFNVTTWWSVSTFADET